MDNNIVKCVIQSVLEDRVEETKASYPDSRSVRDSRDGSPNKSDESGQWGWQWKSKATGWGTPPQTLGPCSLPSLGGLFSPGACLAILSPSGFDIPMVKITVCLLFTLPVSFLGTGPSEP